MRIDALNAEIVASRQLVETPDILKILFRGTKADLGIIERIRSQGYPTLEAFWRETVGLTDHGHLLGNGNGYQKLRPSSRVRTGDGLPGVDAGISMSCRRSRLHRLPVFPSMAAFSICFRLTAYTTQDQSICLLGRSLLFISHHRLQQVASMLRSQRVALSSTRLFTVTVRTGIQMPAPLFAIWRWF